METGTYLNGGREEGMMECDGAKSVSSTPSTSSSESSPRLMKLFCVCSRRCKREERKGSLPGVCVCGVGMCASMHVCVSACV